jgi:hypothetical protein
VIQQRAGSRRKGFTDASAFVGAALDYEHCQAALVAQLDGASESGRTATYDEDVAAVHAI